MIESRLPSPATLIAIVALLVALTGSAIAADVFPKLTKAKVRKIAVKEIERRTSAIAATEVQRLAADIANGEITERLALEAPHIVGTPGEPSYAAGWQTEAGSVPAAFWKDAVGMIHLRGVPRGPSGTTEMFTLPPSHRPDTPVLVNPSFGAKAITVGNNGVVTVDCGAASCNLTLDGVSFRADG